MDAREKAIELIKLYYKLSTKLELSFFIKKSLWILWFDKKSKAKWWRH